MSGKPQSNVYFGIEYDCPSDPGQLPILTLIINHTNQQKALAKKVPLNTGLEKSAAIRPFATKKSRLASENILLVDSLATESCRLADRLATKLFSKRTTLDANRTWSRKVRQIYKICLRFFYFFAPGLSYDLSKLADNFTLFFDIERP